jgi:hypothetical protein
MTEAERRYEEVQRQRVSRAVTTVRWSYTVSAHSCLKYGICRWRCGRTPSGWSTGPLGDGGKSHLGVAASIRTRFRTTLLPADVQREARAYQSRHMSHKDRVAEYNDKLEKLR